MIQVGTSGFSYADWVGSFYPVGTARGDMLSYYATRFSMVELDFTYYRMPSSRTLAAMESKTPGDFCFCLKLFRDLTHKPGISGAEMSALCEQFRLALSPILTAGKLGCLLAQFPWSFRPGSENLEYLAALRTGLQELPLVVEFRNAEWVGEETLRFLSEFDLGFCCVDEPALPGLFPPLAAATSSIGYVRFHGRNAAKWWRHKEAWERYDYDYTRPELEEWLPRLRKVDACTERTFVLMNNCHAGQAARNALMLLAMLEGRPL